MEFHTFVITLVILQVISSVTALIVAIVGWIRFTPEKMMMKVFPYIKKSGNHYVMFGFIISKRSIKFHYFYVMLVVQMILLIVLFNATFTISYNYNPYDDLDCFALYNETITKVVSEEQAESENVTEMRCYGWNLDITGGIGHAGGAMTLAWIFSSIVLWIKLHLNHKIINCIKNSKTSFGYCGIVTLFLFQCVLGAGTLLAAQLSGVLVTVYKLHPKVVFDITLVSYILISGLLVFPHQKKPKSLADCCQEAVENKQGRQEQYLIPIKNRLRRARDTPIQVDLLVELAQLECKKTLGDVYYYGIEDENEEDENREKMNTILEEEMKIIAQVAYRKVIPGETAL